MSAAPSADTIVQQMICMRGRWGEAIEYLRGALRMHEAMASDVASANARADAAETELRVIRESIREAQARVEEAIAALTRDANTRSLLEGTLAEATHAMERLEGDLRIALGERDGSRDAHDALLVRHIALKQAMLTVRHQLHPSTHGHVLSVIDDALRGGR